MSVTKFLNSRDFYSFEGNCEECREQKEDLIKLTNKPKCNVMEIGFNAGHSAELFLKNNSTLNLTSFDIGSHNYVTAAKEYIDTTYPNRHTLVLGDSKITVPIFYENNKDKKFDIIFIDGCHNYDYASSDMNNCFNLAHKDTIVILDDTIYTPGWDRDWKGGGPTKVWLDYLQQNKITELNRTDYRPGCGMSWGKYVFSKFQ